MSTTLQALERLLLSQEKKKSNQEFKKHYR